MWTDVDSKDRLAKMELSRVRLCQGASFILKACDLGDLENLGCTWSFDAF